MAEFPARVPHITPVGPIFMYRRQFTCVIRPLNGVLRRRLNALLMVFSDTIGGQELDEVVLEGVGFGPPGYVWATPRARQTTQWWTP